VEKGHCMNRKALFLLAVACPWSISPSQSSAGHRSQTGFVVIAAATTAVALWKLSSRIVDRFDKEPFSEEDAKRSLWRRSYNKLIFRSLSPETQTDGICTFIQKRKAEEIAYVFTMQASPKSVLPSFIRSHANTFLIAAINTKDLGKIEKVAKQFQLKCNPTSIGVCNMTNVICAALQTENEHVIDAVLKYQPDGKCTVDDGITIISAAAQTENPAVIEKIRHYLSQLTPSQLPLEKIQGLTQQIAAITSRISPKDIT
jgi:hypothetical protein